VVPGSDGVGAGAWVVLGEGPQRGVSGDFLQDREWAVLVFEFSDAGVAQLVQGPAGGGGEQLGGAAVGQPGTAGGEVLVGAGHRCSGEPVGEEDWSRSPRRAESGE
jgi:hypothetical protein